MKKKKIVSIKLADKNGNVLSLIMVAVVIVLGLSSLSIVLGVKSLLSEEKSSTLDFDNSLFISDVGFIKEEIVVETGSELPRVKDYFIPDEDVSNTTVRYFDSIQIVDVNDFTELRDGKRYVKGVKEFYVLINHDGVDYESILRIVDNISPVVTFKDVNVSINDEVSADSFIDTYNDNSLVKDYSATIKNNVSTKKTGTFDITIEVCDLGGNCVRETTKLIVNDSIENSNDDLIN